MNHRERIVIYALLSTLLVVNGLVLLGSTGPAAYAAPLTEDDPFSEDYSIAYAHIGAILNKQLAREEFEEERLALGEELQDKDNEYRDELNALNERLQQLDQSSPEAQGLIQQGQVMLQQYRQWTQQSTAQQGELAAQHLEKAYRELVTAVNIVADRLDIDIVNRFIPVDDPFNAANPETATMAIRLRPALRYPEGLDITPEVMEELALEAD